MLNPSRVGPGLYAHAKLKATNANLNQSNNRLNISLNHILNRSNSKSNSIACDKLLSSQLFNDTIPESDSTPHINVGPQYQCTIPPRIKMTGKDNREPNYEHLLWDPGINAICTETERMYLTKYFCPNEHFS